MSEHMTPAQYRAALVADSLGKRRKNKFGAKSITIDGHYFPSQLEGKRYCALKLLVRAGYIKDLKLQPRFDLSSAGEKVGEYRGDFSYLEWLNDGDTWRPVVEDTKGAITPLYTLKKALFLRLYPHIDFREIGKHGRRNA